MMDAPELVTAANIRSMRPGWTVAPELAAGVELFPLGPARRAMSVTLQSIDGDDGAPCSNSASTWFLSARGKSAAGPPPPPPPPPNTWPPPRPLDPRSPALS